MGGGAPQDGGCPSAVPELAATIAIDPATMLNTFHPNLMFGVNSGFFIGESDSLATQAKVEAAGSTFIRYPGGSSSDDYHWNGTGQYDAAAHWVPSGTDFSAGFPGVELHRGTTSSPYQIPAFVTDGDPATRWLSNVDTDFPGEQWVYLDFGDVEIVDTLRIVWGDPYAASFRVQSWSSGSQYFSWPYQAQGGNWNDVAGAVAGSGGMQTISFEPIGARYIRILMTSSSAGSGGAYSIAEIYALNGGNQISVNTPSVAQTNTTASSTDPASATDPAAYSGLNFNFEQFMGYVHSFAPPAIPILTVNVGTGTPQEAAAWVHYANVVRGYGITYWEIGNEVNGNWETGGPINAQDYVRRYAEYYAAMKAEDPTIVVSGAVSGGTDPSNLGDGRAFTQDLVSILHARGQDGTLDAVSLHWYPNYDESDVDTAVGTSAQISGFAATFEGWLANTGVPRNVPVLMSEYNLALASPQIPVMGNQLAAGIWLAGWVGEFIRYFGQNGGANLWNVMSSWQTSDTSDGTVGDLGYLQHNDNGYRYQEHATYWALQMMSRDWAIAADSRPHALVRSTCSATALATYADLRPDGVLALLVANRDRANAYRAALSTGTFAAAATARAWTFSADNYEWETAAPPFHADPDTPPTPVTLTAGPSGAYAILFPPFSLTVVQLTDAAHPELAPAAPPASCR